MLRSLLTLLAILVAGMAILSDRPWLNVVTGMILMTLLGLLGWWAWTTYWTEEADRPRPGPESEKSEPSPEELGIVDIQPQDAPDQAAQGQAVQDEAADAAQAAPPSPDAASSGAPPVSEPSSTDEEVSDGRPVETAEAEESPTDTRDAPVLGPLLESARAALDARTVCLLVQEEIAFTYRIEAAASTHPSVRQSGTFDAQTPLLTATMSRQSVTLRTLAEEEIAVEDLGYYEDSPAVDHLAVAPVSQPDASAATFLLADAPEPSDLGTSRARTLIEHFAETVGLFLDIGRSPSEQSDAGSLDGLSADQDANGSVAAPDLEEDATESPRPRREIIAEEMERTQRAEEDLALALVHLNRAESISRRGEEAIASAERLFQARLEQLAPNQRVERFGELTYGIFFREGAEAIEPWMADFESTMAQEEGELEGGVSVGVAVWAEETPEALRSEATKALREAYETGTCTIVT